DILSGGKRSEEQQAVVLAFCAKVKFFNHLDEDVLSKLCRSLILHQYNANAEIFREGDEGKDFFIILSGKCSLWKEPAGADQSSEEQQKPGDGGHHPTFHSKHGDGAHHSKNTMDVQREGLRQGADMMPDLENAPVMAQSAERLLVTHREAGESFGEAALLYNKKRALTVVTDEPCIFAVVTRDDYLRILRDARNKMTKMKVNFCCRLPVFKYCSLMDLDQLAEGFYIQQFKVGSTLLRQGGQPSCLYFIMSGTVELLQDPALLQSNKGKVVHFEQKDLHFLAKNSRDKAVDKYEAAGKSKAKIMDVIDDAADSHTLAEPNPARSVVLEVRGPGSYFGHEPILWRRKQQSSVMAKTDVKTLVLTGPDFMARVPGEVRSNGPHRPTPPAGTSIPAPASPPASSCCEPPLWRILGTRHCR
ncbi:hypothetical protein CYMTET_4759, partial [Cymbomonas tetramitiformis]